MQEELRGGCTSFSRLIVEPQALLIDGNDFEQNKTGAVPDAMRSVIVLEGPGTLQENFHIYRNINFTLSEVEQILTMWKEKFFDVSNNCKLSIIMYYFVVIAGNKL